MMLPTCAMPISVVKIRFSNFGWLWSRIHMQSCYIDQLVVSGTFDVKSSWLFVPGIDSHPGLELLVVVQSVQ